jgi:hypothetical protein
MLTCLRSECTVAETGRCLLNNDPESCPERTGSPVQASSLTGIPAITVAPLERPVERPRFPHSLAFTPEDLRSLTGSRYQFLVGILGSPKAGKTALLVSLYLLAANGKFEGFQIADCQTLMGIDDISRGARWWNQGQLPEEMTIHTERPDERTAGFLHLRLKRLNGGKLFDLLLPDLPGEWSDALINHNRTDRLSFLKSADVLWLTLDGSDLRKSRQQVLHRTQLLFQRIKAYLGPYTPKIIVVISHLDGGEPEERSVEVLQKEATRHELDLSIINVASFSDRHGVAPGTGLIDLVTATFEADTPARTTFWPDSERPNAGRYILRIRTDVRNSK